MIASEPCDLDVPEAVALLGRGDLSAVELARSALTRFPCMPPAHHPFVRIRDEQSILAEAAQRDAARVAGQPLGPLHGVPVAIKDIVDVAGLATECGSRALAGATPATADAPLVAALKRAGAIVLGKTATQEFAAGVVTAPVRNPWDLERIPGGSSGGSAVAVATGMALIAIGTDTGGSIRIPASVCGVVGLKPTFGIVPTAGVFPLSWSLDHAGPLARTVAAAAIALDAISSRPIRAAGELGSDVSGLRVGVPRRFFYEGLERDVRLALADAVAAFAALGAEIVEADWADAAAARAAGFVLNRVESAAVHERRLRTEPELLGEELRLRLLAGLLLPARDYVRALQARQVCKTSIAGHFRDHRLDAMLLPATPGVAAPAADPTVEDEAGNRESVHVAYTRVNMPINLTGQPALAVPCGFDDRGLPIGLQLVGRPYGEARICRLGAAYETATRWIDRRRPFIEDRRA